MRQPVMGRRVLVLQRRGYVLTWFLFVLMHALFSFGLSPEAPPPVKVQLLTLCIYLLTGPAKGAPDPHRDRAPGMPEV